VLCIIEDAYLTILRRTPDISGLERYTEELSSGTLTPLALYHELVDSAEFAERQLLASAPTLAATWSLGNAVQPAGHADEHEQPQNVVAAIFETVLNRGPDDAALKSYSHALATGALRPLLMVRELLGSDEFGAQAARHAPVARHLARTIITILMSRDPGSDTVDAYSAALQSGYGLADFMQELLSSPEYAQRVGRAEAIVEPGAAAPFELGRLAEGLIAEHLTSEGCRLATPPGDSASESFVANERMRSMLQTLSMLALSE
jgi:hypothetical protein